MIDRDIIINDEHLTAIAEENKKQYDDLITTYRKYIKILENVRDNAIKSGDTHQAIEEFIKAAKEIINTDDTADIGDCVRTTIEVFLMDIDDADKYLY